MCENTAKEYGLYPKKGAIEIGCDADIVILDMDKQDVMRNEDTYQDAGGPPRGPPFEGRAFNRFVRAKQSTTTAKWSANPAGKVVKSVK
jgi:dihydroorotase-like cyclic amidohydrolase